MEKKEIAFDDVWLHYDETAQYKYSYKYPRWCVTADTVVFERKDGALKVLLIQRAGEPFKGMWALPGGFVDVDEDVTAGARRELLEETNMRVGDIHQLGCYSTPRRDPRAPVLTIAHYAFVEEDSVTPGDDAADARWFDVNNLPQLAFDHSQIISDALEHIK